MNTLQYVNLSRHVNGATHTRDHTNDCFITLQSNHIHTYQSYNSLDMAQLKGEIEEIDFVLKLEDDLDGVFTQYNTTVSDLTKEVHLSFCEDNYYLFTLMNLPQQNLKCTKLL